MFDHRVYQNQLVAFWFEREILVFQRAAVEAHEVVFLPENGSKLVHDAAHHTTIVVLGGLPDLGQLEFVDFNAVHLTDAECIRTFQCC